MKTRALKQTLRAVGVITSIGLWLTLRPAAAQEPASAWPRRSVVQPYRVTLYEPEVESYEQGWMTARSAVSVVVDGAEPVFGAAWFGLRLDANEARTRVHVSALRVDEVRFPTDAPIKDAELERILSSSLVGADLPLEPLLASLARDNVEAEAAVAGSQAVPDILFSMVPVALVRIDGEPELKGLPDLDLLAVLNSNTPIFLQKGTALWFMQVDGQWLTATAVTGPWKDADSVPESVRKAGASSAAAGASTAVRPQIVVVTRPTEVICTEGEPRYAVIPGTSLLYVKNTDSDLFLDIAGQTHYALLAGRWFATSDPQFGPWRALAAEELPNGFALIPENSPKYGVLAHVPGTVAAREAIRDAEIPRTQAVKREPLSLSVEYEGTPEFVQAGTTTVYYAVNTPYSVLRLSPYYYLCHRGVWYYGSAAIGPWAVCVNVPSVIYSIPPACPVYPVTYVRVYDWTPEVVYCGFTSGYLGWYVGGPSLVFGLAYYDTAWWGPRHSRYYYHQNYRCGYYPQHRSYDRSHNDWKPVLFPPLLPLPFAPFLYGRPGPEYHRVRNDRLRERDDLSLRQMPSRPNRYDQEPTFSLPRRSHGGETTGQDRGREGLATRRDERSDRTPWGRTTNARDPRSDGARPERPETAPGERSDRGRLERPQTAPGERSDRARLERPETAPGERSDRTRSERSERTPAAAQPLIRREPVVREERSERTTPAAQPLIRAEPVVREERSERTTPAAQPLIRREPMVRGERDARPAAATPAERVDRRSEAPPPAAVPQAEPKTVPGPWTEPRAVEPRSATAPMVRSTPTREAPAESRRTAPAPLVRNEPSGRATVEGTDDDRQSTDSAPSSTSSRGRKSSRGR